MPYPILNLPYGLQQRLCELATPREKYLLQTAAGSMKHHLKPIQRTIMWPNQYEHILIRYMEIVSLTSYTKNDNYSEYFTKPDGSNSNLIALNNNLKLEYLKESDLDDTFFDHKLLMIEELKFYSSSMSDLVLQRISSNCLSPILSIYARDARDCEAVNIGRLFTLFPHLQTVNLDGHINVTKNWLRDILKLEPQGLKELSLKGTVDNVMSFDREELVQLFMTRHDVVLELSVTHFSKVDITAIMSTLVDKQYFKTVNHLQGPVLQVLLVNPNNKRKAFHYNFCM